MFRKNNWIKRQKLQFKNKEDSQKLRLLKMQQPTDLAIKKQVSVEVDEKHLQVAKDSASKKTSAKKSNF